jgi:hypothetical protein
MEISIPNSSGSNNFRSTIYCSMAKQKLELTFLNGLVIGILLSMSLSTVLIDSFFVSKDVFKLKTIYVNGRIYKLVEDR